MYEFVTVHMLWLSVILCLFGIAVKTFRLISLSQKTVRATSPSLQVEAEKFNYNNLIKRLKSFFCNFFLSDDPLLYYTTAVFHILLIITPVFLFSHSILLYRYWGIDIGFIPDWLGDIFTLLIIASGIVLLLRRIVLPEVNGLTGISDYILLFISLAPFLTGLMAYHHAGSAEIMILAHIISAEIFLISIGWTKLGHMVFFVFARFFIASEFSFTGGSRKW